MSDHAGSGRASIELLNTEHWNWLASLPEPEPDPPGPLNRLQFACWKRSRLVWLGNVMSDVRYLLWRLVR